MREEAAAQERAELALDEAKEGLAALERGVPRPDFAEVVDEVRDALREEAVGILDHADLELCTIARTAVASSASESSGDASSPPEREPTDVRHRFAGKPERRPDARRIVVLRDRRRGRPPNGSRRHGSDPPA